MLRSSSIQENDEERRPRTILGEINRAWQGLCTLCICVPCGLNPIIPLRAIALISFVLGSISVILGIWLLVLVNLHSSSQKEQLMFEKLQTLDSSNKNYFENESPIIFTPVNNLMFYFISMSTIAILGGVARTLASYYMDHHIRLQSLLPGLISWAWVILSMFVVVSLGLISVDTLFTLSHNDLTPPYQRDFFFKNDTYGFYYFCHVLKWFVTVDFVLTSYFQWVVRWFHRTALFVTPTLSNCSTGFGDP